MSGINSRVHPVGAYASSMGWQLFFWILAALLAIASLIMNFARTPPEVAISNLSLWVEWFGFHNIPAWLVDRRADEVARRWAARAMLALVPIGIGGAVIYFTPLRSIIAIPSDIIPPSPLSEPATPDKKKHNAPVYGSLQPWQTTIFIDALIGIREDLPSQMMIARPHMLEPQSFSRVFENAALRAGITPIVIEQNPTGPDQTGVMIAVPDTNAPSKIALRMRGVVQQLGFEGRLVPLLPPASSQAKEVGNFAIFIGPSPL